MCGSWDSKFSNMMGVRKSTNARTKLPSRIDLAKIMNFRAFAALVPMCAQRVWDVNCSCSDKEMLIRQGG